MARANVGGLMAAAEELEWAAEEKTASAQSRSLTGPHDMRRFTKVHKFDWAAGHENFRHSAQV